MEGTYLALTANVATAAVQEASLRGQIAATLELVKDERDQLVIVSNEFDLGGASKADVLTQQTLLAQTEATLPAPMAVGLGNGAEQNAPLGRAVIGGLIFATAITLFVVPAVYSIFTRNFISKRARDARINRYAPAVLIGD